MADDLVKGVSMDTVVEDMREKIKQGFVAAIPDEQWEEMIRSGVKEYNKPQTDYRGEVAGPSRFQTDVTEILGEHVREQLQARMREMDHNEVTKLVMEWLEKHQETMIQEMFGSALSSALQQGVATMVGYVGTQVEDAIQQAQSNNRY